MGNTVGPFTSSRLISSKCDRSPGPIKSDSVSEWKLELFELFELVRSGGEPGALMSGGYVVRVAMMCRSFLVRVLVVVYGDLVYGFA